MNVVDALATMKKAIAGLLAGALVSFLMKHNVVIADNLPDAIEVLISAALTFIIVYVSPKNQPAK